MNALPVLRRALLCGAVALGACGDDCDGSKPPCGSEAGAAALLTDAGVVTGAIPTCRDEMLFPDESVRGGILLTCAHPDHRGAAVPYGDKRVALLCSCPRR